MSEKEKCKQDRFIKLAREIYAEKKGTLTWNQAQKKASKMMKNGTDKRSYEKYTRLLFEKQAGEKLSPEELKFLKDNKSKFKQKVINEIGEKDYRNFRNAKKAAKKSMKPRI